MASFALYGVSFKSHSKPGKGEIGYFDSTVALDHEYVQSYGLIKGIFTITTNSGVVCYETIRPAMASIGAVLAGLGGARNCKPAKGTYFGNFECEIRLDEGTARPYGRLSGVTEISTVKGIELYGMRVQLDATLNLRFDTKIDNRTTSHRKMEGMLQGCSDPGDGYYISSPVMEQLGTTNDEQDPDGTMMTIPPGSHSYPFTLVMPGEPLPSPFRSPYANLIYKVVVYMKSCYCYVQVAEKPLKFRGHYNLSLLPNHSEPLKHESGFNKSLFSKQKAITATFIVGQMGYLPGEEVIFTLSIANPKGYVVRKTSVNLVRRTVYNVNGATKTTLVNLGDSYESGESSKDEEIFSSGKITIPRNCMPSYGVKSSVYSVTHLMQYQVKVAEYPGPMKGQVEVIIGTTRDSVDTLMSKRISSLHVEDTFTQSEGERERSNSITSRLSDSSVMTTASLPPTYSQLSSRAVSMLSLETLPPHYDELSPQ